MDLNSNVQNIKGVGPARAKQLSKLDIYTIKDVLFYFPRDYLDMSPLTFKQGAEDKTGAFPCVVTGRAATTKTNSGLYITKVPVSDGQNKGYAVFFNQPFIERSFYPHQKLILIGKIRKNFGTYEISAPEWIKFEEIKQGEKLEKIRPIYPLTKGVSQNFLRSIVKNALEVVSSIGDTLPEDIIKEYNLLSLKEAIKNIHFPQSFNMLEKARQRFVFEELLLFQLSAGLSRYCVKAEKRKNMYKNLELTPFLSSLPFSLTSGQKKVLEEIVEDLRSKNVMSRLVQGDVGSGKTIIACAALYLAAKNGLQGAMMAPTEILADQHYNTLKKFLKPHGVNVEILKGGLAGKERKKILSQLKNGSIDVLVGTHAILEEDVMFKKLGMIITDEQHRFGVKQRENLVKKGYSPDVIVMSATPIPRTAAMALYGDLDISIIDTLPKGRQKVDTYVVQDSMRKKVYDFAALEIKKGHLVYVVCPAVEENELDVANVEEHAAWLKENYPSLKIGILHGKMKQDEKDEILGRFLRKEIQALVATTVVEVGIDVPDATLIIVENAERFGLAQLHQLRGRVGRSSLKSYCILMTASSQPEALTRLKFLMKCQDGFEISQKDLEMRGPGEFLGIRQHGFFEFKFASFVENTDILETTQKLASEILQKNYLQLPEYKNLKELLENKAKDAIN